MCADLKAGGGETGQEAEVCKAFLCDCRCRQLRKGLVCRETDRQWGAGSLFGPFRMKSRSAGIYWAPTVCLSMRNTTGKKRWFLQAPCHKSCEKRGHHPAMG